MSSPGRDPEMSDEQVDTFPRLADSGVSVRAKHVVFPYLIAPHLLAHRVIGEGGTAIVYEALHTRLKVNVAVKILKLSGSGASEARERMQREAELCARIDNPRIPRIYDVDVLEDGTPYVVMEEVHGRPLDELLGNGPLDVDLACAITCEVLEALAELHSAGIVHRDIKPSNLILEENENEALRVRVLDLGIAKPLTEGSGLSASARLTLSGTLLGTPHYMSNEQLLGLDADERADLYAVGVMLYEILAGQTPFEGESVSQVIASALRDEPLPLSKLRKDVPAALQAIVVRAMQRDLSLRYSSAHEMLKDLRTFQANEKLGCADTSLFLPPPAPELTASQSVDLRSALPNSGLRPIASSALLQTPVLQQETLPHVENAQWAARALHSLPPVQPVSKWRRVRVWSGIALAVAGAAVAIAWPSELGEPRVPVSQGSVPTAGVASVPVDQHALTEPPHSTPRLSLGAETQLKVSPELSPAPLLFPMVPVGPSASPLLEEDSEAGTTVVNQVSDTPLTESVTAAEGAAPSERAGVAPAAAEATAEPAGGELAARYKRGKRNNRSARASEPATSTPLASPTSTPLNAEPTSTPLNAEPTSTPLHAEPAPGMPLNPYLERFDNTLNLEVPEVEASTPGLPSNPYAGQ